MACGEDELRKAHLVGEFTQCLTGNKFRTGIRQEALALALIMAIDDMTNCCIEDGVPKKLQSLIIQRLALVVAPADTLMHQSLTVVLDVVGIEAQYLVESRKKLLFLAEREPYSVNDIINPHTS